MLVDIMLVIMGVITEINWMGMLMVQPKLFLFRMTSESMEPPRTMAGSVLIR